MQNAFVSCCAKEGGDGLRLAVGEPPTAASLLVHYVPYFPDRVISRSDFYDDSVSVIDEESASLIKRSYVRILALRFAFCDR